MKKLFLFILSLARIIRELLHAPDGRLAIGSFREINTTLLQNKVILAF